MGPRTGLDDMEKRKFLTLPGLEPRPIRRPAAASRCTDCAIATPQIFSSTPYTRPLPAYKVQHKHRINTDTDEYPEWDLNPAYQFRTKEGNTNLRPRGYDSRQFVFHEMKEYEMDQQCYMHSGDVNCTHNFVPSTRTGCEDNIKIESYRSRVLQFGLY
jgi:hypothetical protein